MSTINTEQIDKINAQLEGLINYMDAAAEDIQTAINNASTNAQEVANEKMAELSTKVNEKLSSSREQIINIFHGQYQAAMEKIKPIEPLLNISISLDTVVSVVTSIIEIITAPYQPIIEFTTQIIPKVLTLSANLQKIASYQPSINVPGVEVPPLDINVEPITAEDITG